MSKINVLVVPSDRTGVSYYRSTKPHIYLEQMYPDEFHVDIEYEPKLDDDEWLKKYDIIHYHRTLGPYEGMESLLKRTKKLGIKTVLDIDDHWSPGKHHPAYILIKKNKIDEKILNNIRLADNIITTTPIFADKLKRYNNNIIVLPNAIDPEEQQFKPNPIPSDKVRIGWLGGSSHFFDLLILKDVVPKLINNHFIDKSQFVLCGYDLRGTITEINEETGEQKQRKIQPHESVWFKYEQIFTGNYSSVSPKYREFLLRFINEGYNGVENEAYKRVWTKPISSYASNYNQFDISLAPLEENAFNMVKSQLKVIEAGFHKKALIAQDFGPYKIDCVDGRNSLLVPSKKNNKLWSKHVNKLINNPSMVEDLGEALYETVKDKYHLKTVSEKRRDFYKELVNK